ncbi:hypothetical protein BJF93_14170 [Xaviernesmea oryzae]|uniref:Hemin uptake protein HemP n=1 Tax=Xaviernesmea oryzae TaxID=464029 RepID=A0A1Q9ARA4_9HYPH|nr:hemin uptake protein HemP [Xaviernesmea oryzae]OLP57973.1 hypothetical protein BJF93_14170 [Xaviernesmea oryzae]SEL28445.1 Hemin uptake protein HemP [Xaviernesmea oryzae]
MQDDREAEWLTDAAPATTPVSIGSDQPEALRVLSSAALFSGTREVVIDHQGMRYRLKITRQGKLILIK